MVTPARRRRDVIAALSVNGDWTILLPVSELQCDMCRAKLPEVPALAIYMPDDDLYKLLCRPCTSQVLTWASAGGQTDQPEST